MYKLQLSQIKDKYIENRDGMIQGTGVSMHHAKGITIPQYITTLEHFYDQYTKAMI